MDHYPICKYIFDIDINVMNFLTFFVNSTVSNNSLIKTHINILLKNYLLTTKANKKRIIVKYL